MRSWRIFIGIAASTVLFGISNGHALCLGDNCTVAPILTEEPGSLVEAEISTDTALVVESQCGNGQIETGESCDDGNLLNNDGCNAACQQTL